MSNHLHDVLGPTPQTEPIMGKNMIKNNAGGYSFAVDKWERLRRFLVLGSEGGTYYVGERQLTIENTQSVMECAQEDGKKAIQIILSYSQEGRVPKVDTCLFSWAILCAKGIPEVREMAWTSLPLIARTGSHILQFLSYYNKLGTWSRMSRRGLARWYTNRNADALAFQVVKYRDRSGFTHRDAMRLCHPRPVGSHQDIIHWAVKGWETIGEEPHTDQNLLQIWAYERAKRALSAAEIVHLIVDYNLPRECIPTQYLNDRDVWAALFDNAMGYTAMIRNIATMTRNGLLTDFSEHTGKLIEKLGDSDAIRKARVHPIQILAASCTYASGTSERGSNTWTPVRKIIDALDDAFYKSFATVQPTGKRFMLGLDVSGSMQGQRVNGIHNMTANAAQATMALVTDSVEAASIIAYDTKAYPVTITSRQRLTDVISGVSSLGGGGTNCAIPIAYATDNNLPIDAFVIYTDSETWAGRTHPIEALDAYRNKSGIDAKLIVVAMAANRISIADSKDTRQINLVGFDTNTPQIISEFAAS